MKKIFLMAGIAMGVLGSAIAQKSPYTLQYEMKKGDKFFVENTQETKIAQNFMGQEQKQDNNVFSTFELEVIDNGKIQVVFKRFKNELKSAGQSMVMDSDNAEDENPATDIFRKMIGKPFTVTVSKQGEVTGVEGLSKIMEDIIQGLDGMEPAMKETMSTQLSNTLSDNSFKGTLQSLFIKYPTNAVKLNDTWDESYDLKTMTEMVVKNNHTLTSVKDGKTNITSKGSNNIKDPNAVVELTAGLEAKYALNGVTSQTTVSDLKSGWPTEINQKTEMTGSLKLQPGPQIPAEMDIPMTINSTSVYKIVKK